LGQRCKNNRDGRPFYEVWNLLKIKTIGARPPSSEREASTLRAQNRQPEVENPQILETIPGMKIHRFGLGLTLFALGTAHGQVAPGLLSESRATLKATEPYKWSLYVNANGGRASGVAVGPRVYLTAGHVVFDRGAWLSAGSIRAYWANHSSSTSTGESLVGLGVRRWANYSARVANDGTDAGVSAIDTFNLDFAAVYTRDALLTDESFAPVVIDPEDPDQISFLRRASEKTIVGYPADSDFISSGNIGRMHQNAPGDYETYWWASADDPLDSEGLWTGTHYFSDVVTYGGNSGGPVYGKGANDRWVLSGVLVGGSDRNSTVRGIDESAWELVENALQFSRRTPPVRQVQDLSATAQEDGSVALEWTDRSGGETAYVIERRQANGYIPIAELEANAESWTDTTLPPGSVAHYRVTPRQGPSLVAPPSQRVRAETPGLQPALGASLGEPLLAFRTRGDAPMHVVGGEVVSGKIWGMETSHLELDLLGPGQLQFEWSVSSEVNQDFDDPFSPWQGDIYDAFFFYRNDIQEHYISGLGISETRSIEVADGPNVLRWTYSKDPYSDEGEDRGKLKSVRWIPSPSNPHPYGARLYSENIAETTWMGYYATDFFPWVFHFDLGWLSFQAAGEGKVWAYSPVDPLGWLYISPETYPYVYSSAIGGWLFYLEGSAANGSGGWLYDFTNQVWRQMP
jgi:V8-like Glu-specific endopeptidase